ncbi:MAG: hypothetical protein ACE5JG_07425 [Planctomycetota bacterium]
MILAAAVLGAALGPARELGAGCRRAGWDGRTFTVHEWGTFTAVQGSGGVVLDGLLHEERDLPAFVYDLRDFAGLTGVSPKMETPVIYFYSAGPRKVRVDVGFPRGVVTQWFPAATRVNHRGVRRGTPITDLRDGFIGWGSLGDLNVLAPGTDARVPRVRDDDPWRFARRVRANTLGVCNANSARESAGSGVDFQYEKFLFYRGLGDFDLPLRAEVASETAGDDRCAVRLRLQNTRPDEPLAHLFVIRVQGGRSGFRYLPALKGSTDLASLEIELRPVEESTGRLVGRLAAALTATGLFPDEARAMARTWERGYFQDEGLRVLYVLPRALVDRELPLKVTDHSGKAREFAVVRTFVGRLEVLSPEREARMVRALHDYAHGAAERRREAGATIARWGRFAIPYLNRVRSLSADAAVRAEAGTLLRDLQLRR